MKTKTEIIAELEKEYPTLTRGEDEKTIELSPIEYKEIIEKWADDKLAYEAKAAANEAKAEADKAAAEQSAIDKAALLERLGISTDEAKLLLS